MLRTLTVFLLLMCWVGSVPDATAQGSCGPSLLGEPCANGGIAALGNQQAGLNPSAGNPIHLVTGNKYQKEIDLPVNPYAPGIEIVRHYNAQDVRSSVLGRGWTLSYDTRLFQVGTSWQIVQADGSRVTFTGASGKPLPNEQGRLTTDQGHWIWTWPTGGHLQFNTQGYLSRIQTGNGVTVYIHRSQSSGPLANTIERVSSASASLAFSYRIVGNEAVLSHVDTALGRFQYNVAATLAGVTRPDGMQRRYLYEAELQSGNIYALTGIEIVPARGVAVRANTWAYDKQGRAVLSVAGPPGSKAARVALSYVSRPAPDAPGLTLVRGPQDQETRFHTAVRRGRYLITDVQGVTCSGCAAAGSTARYDSYGRLIRLNDLLIHRDGYGAIVRIEPKAPGWPGLTLDYQSNKLRQSWSTPLTGTEHISYNPQRLPVQRVFANGESVRFNYDSLQRPNRLIENKHSATIETTLAWRGSLLARIAHPMETETREYDQHRRLIKRGLRRPANTGSEPLHYSESFAYDTANRLTQHHLPEGGLLAYTWAPNGRLAGIAWHDAKGKAHTLISTVAGETGYRYGNGLHLRSVGGAHGQVSGLILSRHNQPIWTLSQHYNELGLLQQEDHAVPEADYSESWRYAYDAAYRMVGAKQYGHALIPASKWYAWNDDGSMAARRDNGLSHKPLIHRDASGLPITVNDYALAYGSNRRLKRVSQHGRELAAYTHNAFGHRIAKRSSAGQVDYFYLDNQLVAERSHPSVNNQRANLVSRRYVYAQHVLVGIIDYPNDNGPGELYAVHADLVGAPSLVTDSQQNIRWLASYAPGGTATRVAGDLTMDLRFPGQVYDAETGWHDNLLRTYLPGYASYLEPDPLGPVPGTQALGYARQQPRRYVDPMGLLLFAFDGTRHSAATQSNVWKMSQTYRDGPVFYHSGPGNSMYLDWDAITATRADTIVNTQWQSLLNVLSHEGSLSDHIPIDIIGFSRGAALARHFGNMINQHVDSGLFSYNDALRGPINACVDLRFMGLFDTVAQFGPASIHNANYDLTIASAWEWVAHAVALHERRWLFPLTGAADTGGGNIIEAPFIGAHADIGGGTLYEDGQPSTRGDLADVALNWMLWQARAATLRFHLADASDREITDPILHDHRSPLIRSVQDGDRSVSQASGALLHNYQDDHPQLGRVQRSSAEEAILRHENWRSSAGAEVGVVNMDGYARWLHDELGWQAMPS